MLWLKDLLKTSSFYFNEEAQSIEEWHPVKGFENLYVINETGDIRSLHTRNFSNLITKRKNTQGYYHVKLKKGKQHTFDVHRLVGLTFHPNPEGKDQINHKDGNKLNNHYTNLEWCTATENIRHAFAHGLVPRKSKTVLDTYTGQVFKNAKEAAIATGINLSTLRNYLNGNIKTNPTCLKYN